MTTDYVFETNGRRPVVWFALMVLLFLLAIAYYNSAPLVVWIIWGLTTAAILYLLIKNPHSGIRLTDAELVQWDGGPEQSIAFSQIDHFEIIDWTDSTDYGVHLKNGERITLGSTSMPATSRLRAQLEKRGVAVEIR